MGEFRDMVQEMGLGLTKARVVELFELFDDDGSGGVDAKEFVKTLFPNEFHDIYERRQDASNRCPSQGSTFSSELASPTLANAPPTETQRPFNSEADASDSVVVHM